MQDAEHKRRRLSPSPQLGGWHMPGRIFKREGSYVLKIYAGREGGKKKDKWLTFRTRQEAEAAQRELASHILAHSAGIGLYGSPRERLGPYLADWVKRQKPHLAPRTYERYDTIIAQVRRDVVGAIPLGRLAARALEDYYTRRIEAGLSPSTVLYAHRIIHRALKDAARQDMIRQNPAAFVKAPKRARTRPDIWTEAQTLLFLSEVRASSRYYPVYVFAVGTGARIGEVLGLRWRDLDLNEGVAYVAQTLQRLRGGGYILRAPKTEQSGRRVALPPEVISELRALKARQEEQRVRRDLCEAGEKCCAQHCLRWHALGLVFVSETGKPLHDGNLRRRDLKRLCEKLGLPWRRAFHNMRHAHGSYLLQRGVSIKVVQERLGHSSAAFTLSTYVHVLAGMQDQAARAVSAMLNGAAE